jgi:hypothetical protein
MVRPKPLNELGFPLEVVFEKMGGGGGSSSGSGKRGSAGRRSRTGRAVAQRGARSTAATARAVAISASVSLMNEPSQAERR